MIPQRTWGAVAVAVVGAVAAAHAGVVVIPQTDGARWPLNAPAVDTAGGKAPGEFTGGVAVKAGVRVAQTFRVAAACALARIDVACSAAQAEGAVGLRLQEVVVTQEAQGAAWAYVEGKSLWGEGLAFRYAGLPKDGGVLTLEFTEGERVRLEPGKTYALEFVGPGDAGRGFVLRRRGASTYPDGALFVDRRSYNGLDTRDLALRLFTDEQPGSAASAAVDVPTVAAVAAPAVYPDFGTGTAAPAVAVAKMEPPKPLPEGRGFIVRLDDYASDPAPWQFFNGAEFPGARGAVTVLGQDPAVGAAVLRLTGDFTQGGKYVGATKNLTMPVGNDLSCIRMRVKSDDVQFVTVRLGDGSGQVHQARNVAVTPDGQWHDLVLNVKDIVGGEHWGGANDGKWQGPAKLLSINIGVMSNPDDKQLELCLADLRAEALDAAVTEGNDTVNAGTTVLAFSPGHAVSRADYGFKLTYRWESKPTERDYKVFLQIVNADGQAVYDDDHYPLLPTSKWNGRVEYTRDVCLPRWLPRGKQTLEALPEGEYTLYAGLYNPLGRKPLKAGEGVTEDGERRFRVGTLTIDNGAALPVLGAQTLDLAGYTLTFSEEFDTDLRVSAWGPIEEGGAKWIAHTPYKGDFGDAKFSDPVEGFPFTVADGALRIECRQEGGRWRSGLISSLDAQGRGFSQQYGYFEMRAKFPATPGTWPGFWLTGTRRVTQPDDKEALNLEIDIVEQYGHWPNKLTTALHIWDRSGKGRGSHVGVRHLVPGMTEDYHTYGALVTPESIVYYYDGVELRREPTPECGHAPLYILAELAAGPGWPLDRTPNPTYLYIDYIRAYAKQ